MTACIATSALEMEEKREERNAMEMRCEMLVIGGDP